MGRVLAKSATTLRFTGVIGGAVLRLLRNLVVWRRSLDIPGWFSMRSIERQTFEQSNDWFPAFEETYGDRYRVTVFDRRQLADETIGVSLPHFPGRTRSALQSTE